MTTEPYVTASSAAASYGAREAVQEQLVDGFGAIRILPLDPRTDIDVVHGWVSQERASFWGMNGLTKEQVHEIYAHMDTLDTHHAFLALKDGEPVGLLQTYEPEADRVSECYEAEPGDIGVHVLLAAPGSGSGSALPERGREPGGGRAGWSSTLLAAFTTYVLIGLDRQRIVVDPDERNEKAIARFVRQGFEPGPAVVLPEIDLPEVYLPEKRAQLAFLRREKTFGQSIGQ